MAFLHELRQAKIIGPTSPRFDVKAWGEQVKRPDMSLDDMEVIALGLLFNIGLQQLRERLVLMNDTTIPDLVKRRGLIAYSNREVLMAEAIHLESAKVVDAEGKVGLDRVATSKIKLPLGEFSADEIIETVIDGVGKLLAMTSVAPDAPLNEALTLSPESLIVDVNIANSYLCLEQLWTQIMWKNTRPVRGREPMTFISSDPSAAGFESISRHRHIMTSSARLNFAVAAARSLVGRQPSARAWALELRFDSGLATITRVGPTHEQSAYRLAVDSVFVPPYYASVLKEPAPTNAVLTLAHVLAAFHSLVTLSQSASFGPREALRVERADESVPMSPVNDFAPWLSRANLVEQLADAMEVTHALSDELVSFFTTGAPEASGPADLRPDLWSAPLVYCGADRLLLAVWPFQGGNIGWLLDRWLKRLGFPLDFRGTEFEEHGRRALVQAVAKSALAPVTTAREEGFKFDTAAGRTEQIDQLFIVNDLIVVAEAKCFLEPISPLEWYNHHDKLLYAVGQAKRKADAVRDNAPQFLARAKQLGMSTPQPYRVAPLVILNHALGAGQAIDGVPIIDQAMLELFFGGSMQWMAVLTTEGEVKSSEVERFFSDPAKADVDLENYLADPPPVRHLRKALTPRGIKFLFPGMTDDVVVSVVLDVDVDKVDLSGSALAPKAD